MDMSVFFGSIKANPWWSTVLMPVIFLFSAIVSGIALVMLIYILLNKIRKIKIDMPCLDTIAKYLFYILIIDFALEGLDQIHYTSFKISLIGTEGFLMASIWLIVPFIILAFQLWLLPPWKKKDELVIVPEA